MRVWITLLYKKRDRKKCRSYRSISVTSSIARLYGRIQKTRIEDEWQDIEKHGGHVQTM